MAKVLLSFLGTGRMLDIHKTNKISRKYDVTKYQIGDKVYESSFIASAIVQYHDIEKIIMIGTPKSMWENVYYFFYTKNHEGKDIDNDESFITIYDDIENHIQTVTPDSSLYVPHKDKIEEAMGGYSKVVLIRYGVNEQQIKENIAHILEIEKYLEPNDELIVDITHSFRSLPIYIMNLLVYLRNVSSKNIKLPHIYYGMFEGMDPGSKIAPVVDLKSLLELQDWIIGAYSMKEYGNAYKLSQLMKTSNPHDKDSKVAKRLEEFSDYVNVNYLGSMMEVVESLNRINGKCENDLAKLVVNPVIENFLKKFKGKHFVEYSFLYWFSQWLYRQKKYAQAYLTLIEAVVSYEIEKMGYSLKEASPGNFLYINENNAWDGIIMRRVIHLSLQLKTSKEDSFIKKEESYANAFSKIKGQIEKRMDYSNLKDEEIVNLIRKADNIISLNPQLKDIFNTLNYYRNNSAHLLVSNYDGKVIDSNELITYLKYTLDFLYNLGKIK